ncbi:2-oxoglutarate and Fe(II)-dependent oxygenase superfamily protein isoform 1 [Hibiscus syriacus]|uniref:2-oxoglutarate and Fe(II)-dependent oxygenase superfamily protein isoform 1 n=1 Tax=Hibiscus syriacus TaxID=106335 RepID=A0A6A3AV88_HIBSY|nr:2-oxoglutarate and Fe(II)-dependent oxygenase superfamily protein isoform 1 [Hibiscus syriacus]
MVIRGSDLDGGSQMVSLGGAVTIVRVKVECALLTEAFVYQRMICTKAREKKFKYEPGGDAFDDLKSQCRSWMEWIEVLVTEFCCLCIRRNVVDQIMELPWNGEEKYIYKCLLDCATDDSGSTIGSLLVVFYLQRYRYVEAYQVNLKIWSLEEDFISTHSGDENFLEALSGMESHRQRRKDLDEGIELLPEVLQQVKTGTLPDIVVDSHHMATPLRPPVSEIPKILGGYVDNSHVEAGTLGSTSILPEGLFVDAERLSNVKGSKNFKFESILSPGIHRASLIFATPLKGISQSQSRELSSRRLREKQSDKIISEGSANNLGSNISVKRGQSDRHDAHWNVLPTEDLMDISWSLGEWSVEERNAHEGMRWRSEETSDDEEQFPYRTTEVGATHTRGRRGRFVR